MYEDILYDVRDRVAAITLDSTRIEKRELSPSLDTRIEEDR